MWLPDFSGSVAIAQLRHIQSIHESGDRRNPDVLVRHFLPLSERWRLARLSKEELVKLRATPLYYYLLARTKYYDQLVGDAAGEGFGLIVNIGCGTDTRAYRFKQLLRDNHVHVIECDLPDAIAAKERMVKWWRRLENLEYLPLDLNDGQWPGLERLLRQYEQTRTLVLLEGVSPYIDARSFEKFLGLLGGCLSPGSRIAYDFKRVGANDDLGRSDRTLHPFRLPIEESAVFARHEELGLRLERMELSDQLEQRLINGTTGARATPLFDQDVLIVLSV
jgi:methyltransferase (TIGR00027 family)